MTRVHPGNPKKLVLDDMVSMYEHSVQGELFYFKSKYFFKIFVNCFSTIVK